MIYAAHITKIERDGGTTKIRATLGAPTGYIGVSGIDLNADVGPCIATALET